MDHGSCGIYVSQDHVTDELAKLSIKANITNDTSSDETIRIWADIIDQDGQVVKYNAANCIIAPTSTTEVTLPIDVGNPILWQGRENPYLYDIHITIMRRNDVIDELTIPTGLRYFKFDSKEKVDLI